MISTDFLIDTIDTHTAGEPTRIVTSGLDTKLPPNGTVREKRDRFRENHDDLRKYLMKEPRGHDSMFGAVPVTPSHDEADVGVFFMDNSGYIDMCGHGIIGFLTAFVEMGSITPEAEFVIETPAGITRARPSVTDAGSVRSVTVQNVESFVADRLTVEFEVDGTRLTVPVSVVYSGNFFALVDSRELGLSIQRRHVDDLVRYGLRLRDAVNREVEITNPSTDAPDQVDLVEFYESSQDGVDRNVTVFGNGLVDRSPCGTGTCAKMAMLHDQGDLRKADEYRHQSVIGTEFTGKILRSDSHDGREVVTPEVTGSAFVTGKHTFVSDPADSLSGFKVNGKD